MLGSSKDFKFEASLLVTILLGSQLIIQPFFIGVFMMKNKSRFKNKEFKKKFEAIYSDIHVTETSQLLYPMISLLRRAIFVLLATLQDGYPYF